MINHHDVKLDEGTKFPPGFEPQRSQSRARQHPKLTVEWQEYEVGGALIRIINTEALKASILHQFMHWRKPFTLGGSYTQNTNDQRAA